jgi:hypothetical protein
MIDLDMGRYAALRLARLGPERRRLAGLAARAVIAARRWSAELAVLEDAPPP